MLMLELDLPVPLASSGSAVTDANDAVLEMLATRTKQLEAVGRRAAGLAHDFNNLLTVIMSYSDLLLSDLPDVHPMRQDLTEIRDAAGRATSLTTQLRTLDPHWGSAPQ